MRKNNTGTLFEKAFLNSLVEDESSCVEVQEKNYHLALHPFHLNNIKESLKDILNQGIAKYDKKLGGILLGYQNIKLLSQSGAIVNDSFFIHVDILASFFLFKSEVGKILTGTVNKKSKDHVACLVHKTFNVSLPKPEDVDDNDDWMGAKVKIGQDILFRIIFVDLEARLPYIRAEFVAILSEPDSGISTSEENIETNPNETNKKPKKIVFESSSEDEKLIVKKKKKKKHKKEDESEDEDQEKGKRKKHKRKSNEEENLDSIDGSEKKKHKKEEESENEDQEKGKRKKHKHKLNEEENVHSIVRNEKKKSKHKDQSGILELEVDDKYDYKRKKSKHKDQSHVADTDNSKSIENDTPTKKKQGKLVGKGNEDHSDIKKKKKHQDQPYEDEYVISEKASKKKRSKHKHDLAEVLDLQENTKKKKKKSKHKDSLEDLRNAVLQRTLLSLSEDQSKDVQKGSRKKHKNKDLNETNVSDDLSSLLPELNLSSLFRENVSNKATAKDNFQMADNEDKISKKRRSSTSHANFWDSKAELMADPDLEKIIQDVDKKIKHKRKREGSDESPTKLAKKRRRNSSSDDFESVIPKKKHKKNL